MGFFIWRFWNKNVFCLESNSLHIFYINMRMKKKIVETKGRRRTLKIAKRGADVILTMKLSINLA